MPHDPTSTGAPHHDPTVCYCCGRRADGAGIGKFSSDRRPNDDPQFLCALCMMIASQIRAVRQWDRYETKAISEVIERLGPQIERNGFDLSEWTEDQVVEFVSSVILEFGDSIRAQVKSQEVPF